MQFIDIHCHPNFPQYDEDRAEILAKMKTEKILGICVGADFKTSKESVKLSEKEEHIYSSIGLHPTHWQDGFDEDEYQKLITPKTVAVGECGLDYFRRDAGEDEKIQQEKILRKQIEFSIKNNLPLMIHCRPSSGEMDAYEDLIPILKCYEGKTFGNIHFFVGNKDIAKELLALGFTMSFTAVVTFSNDYDEVIKFLPTDKIMSETDSPYVAPVSIRGKRNDPTYVKEVVARIAAIKGMPEKALSEAILENARRVFKLPI